MNQVLPALCIGLLLSPMAACAASSPAVKEQADIPQATAVALAQARLPGELIDARMATVGNRSVYQFEIRDLSGIHRWVLVSMSDGSIVEPRSKPRLKD